MDLEIKERIQQLILNKEEGIVISKLKVIIEDLRNEDFDDYDIEMYLIELIGKVMYELKLYDFYEY